MAFVVNKTQLQLSFQANLRILFSWCVFSKSLMFLCLAFQDIQATLLCGRIMCYFESL